MLLQEVVRWLTWKYCTWLSIPSRMLRQSTLLTGSALQCWLSIPSRMLHHSSLTPLIFSSLSFQFLLGCFVKKETLFVVFRELLSIPSRMLRRMVSIIKLHCLPCYFFQFLLGCFNKVPMRLLCWSSDFQFLLGCFRFHPFWRGAAGMEPLSIPSRMLHKPSGVGASGE